MTRRESIWACVVLCAAAVAGKAPTNALATARHALADGLWSVAATNAALAAADGSIRPMARLVELEALARDGRAADMLARIAGWADEASDGIRYWHAWASVQEGQLEQARTLLAEPFADPAYAILALRLRARLEWKSGDRAAAEKFFAQVAARGSNDAVRVENAVEWAMARNDSGDLAGARSVLNGPGVLDAPGRAGDEARLLAADLAERAADADTAHRLRLRLVEGGTNTDERAYVLAACALSDELWNAGKTNQSIAVASNAVARAKQGTLACQAGYRLGFALFRDPLTREAGTARIVSLLRQHPGEAESRVAHLRLADALLAAGDATAADREFRALQQAYPEYALDAHALAGRGWAQLHLGHRTEAVGLFARAAQLATNAAERAVYLFKQGDALMADGNYAEAAAAYARVPAEGGAELAERARFQQADALARAGDADRAVGIFGELMEKGRFTAVEAGLRMAALESAAGRLEGGRTDVASLEPDTRQQADGGGAGANGRARGRMGAIELYDKLLAMDPLTDSQRVAILLGRGKAAYGAYRFEDAEKDFAAVAKLRPERADEMAFLSALCLYGEGRDAEAAAAARALLASTGGRLRADVQFWLAKYDFGHRDYAAARAGFESCATNAHLSAGARIEALGRAARCCAALSDYAGVVDYATRATTNGVAMKAIAQATPETPAVAEVFVLQGEALIELARFSDAVLVLARTQKLAAPPELLRRAAVLKADCLFAMGADDDRSYLQALEEYRAVLRDEELTPSLRLSVSFKIARTLEKLNRLEEVIDQYYDVVMAYRDGLRAKTWFDGEARAFFTRAALILADYYEARGDTRQVVRVLRHLVETGVPAAQEARRRIQQIEKKGGAL